MAQTSSNYHSETMDFEHELEQVARQYRDEGYVVLLHPGADQLPAFAADFGVDLLAVRGEEKVLVQVKEDRASLEADPAIPRRAEIVSANPGWSYDLVLLHGQSPIERIARRFGEPSLEQINLMLEEAQRASQAGALHAGFVLAWAGIEAALRRLAQKVGLQSKGEAQPGLLVRELYVTGNVSPEDYRFLEETHQRRTAIVHGLAPPNLDQGTVQEAINAARRLLAESGTTISAAG